MTAVAALHRQSLISLTVNALNAKERKGREGAGMVGVSLWHVMCPLLHKVLMFSLSVFILIYNALFNCSK